LLGVVYTLDGAHTWHESSLPLRPGWDCMTDPTVAFDDFGNAFLVGEPNRFNSAAAGTSGDLTGLGMVVYRSVDGGVSWQQPIQLTTDTSDDKQWVVCDNNPSSPHYGNVYVAWGASSPLRFARSTDHGATWRGKGSQPPGSTLVSFSFSPEVSVSLDGTLHILWHMDGSTEITYLRSTDGGETFEPQRTIVSGVSSLRGHLPLLSNVWPHFDSGHFRVITVATGCAGIGGSVLTAWADMREGRSRIYFRRSSNAGIDWDGPPAGSPLLPQVNFGDMQCFHPQIACTGTGVIGCAFYVFAQEANRWLIRVNLAVSWDNGLTFSQFIKVSEQSWDPLVNAPFAHGDPNVGFIGEYFGLNAGDDEFALLWTDTRSGVQELMSEVVHTQRIRCPPIPQAVAHILFGVIDDGGGVIFVNGKFIPVPPRWPLLEVLDALATLETLADRPGERTREARLLALRQAAGAIDREIQNISGEIE